MPRVPIPIPRSSYTISRSYPWKHFDEIAWVLAVIGLAILGAVTVATQGYQPQTILSATNNVTDSHWFNRFAPQPSPGSLCDPHVFAVGDTFQTKMSAFQWSLDYIIIPENATLSQVEANDNGFSYSGAALNSAGCDVDGMKITADLSTWTTTISASIVCDGYGVFPVSASTSFVASLYPQKATALGNQFNFQAGPDLPSWQLCNDMYASLAILQSGGVDLLTTMRLLMDQDPDARSNLISLAASSTIPSPCNNASSSPSTATPMDIQLEMLGFSNLTLTANPAAHSIFNAALRDTTSNLFQAMLAAVRVDIGNQCPANFLTQPSLVDAVLQPTPALTNATYAEFLPSLSSSSNTTIGKSLIDILHSDNLFLEDTFLFTLPLYAVNDIFVQAPYLCHVTVLKAPAQLVVSVAVAMAGLFVSGWGLFHGVAAWFATRGKPEANYCDGHLRQFSTDVEKGGGPSSSSGGTTTPSSTEKQQLPACPLLKRSRGWSRSYFTHHRRSSTATTTTDLEKNGGHTAPLMPVLPSAYPYLGELPFEAQSRSRPVSIDERRTFEDRQPDLAFTESPVEERRRFPHI